MFAAPRKVARWHLALFAAVLVSVGFASSLTAGPPVGSVQSKTSDLRVKSFALDRGQAAVGDTVTATVKVSNEGGTPAPSTLLTFWLTAASSSESSSAYRVAAVRLGTLKPRETVTSVSTFTIPDVGHG